MSRVEDRSNKPRAMIHRRILDVANNMPDASLKEIANEVSGASSELVDSVLAEYGDPSDEPGTRAAPTPNRPIRAMAMLIPP